MKGSTGLTVDELARWCGLTPAPVGKLSRSHTAWHEAAHATAALALGVPLKEIRIKRESSAFLRGHRQAGGVTVPGAFAPIAVLAFGHTSSETLHKRAVARRIDKLLAFGLAGPWGDQLRTGVCQGHADDIATVWKQALQSCEHIRDTEKRGAQAVLKLHRAVDVVRPLLQINEAAWGRLAAGLQVRGRLTGEEAALLFRGERPRRSGAK